MSVLMRREIVLPLVTAIIVSVLVTVGWLIAQGGPTKSQSSFCVRGYTSIEELAEASDAVVVGTVNGVAGSAIDYGTENPNEIFGKGHPVLFYEVAVKETLKGETDKTIIVGRTDPEHTITAQITALRDGEELLLFLEKVTSQEAPVVKPYGFTYTPMSLDLGVFDISDDGYAQSRMPDGFRQEPAATFSLTELCERIQVN
ncbi:MAG: hypothetical protein GF414_09565 [Candidatus Altiarchaeales archaeon]|nr:hypothetical protein [Candidatus Altiarchaeales archaeon]